MLELEEWMDIKDLSREGLSIRAIAKETGMARNTVRRVLREKTPAAFDAPARSSCLDEFRTYVKERYDKFGLSSVRLMAEIAPMGYAGSLRTLRRYVQSLQPLRKAALVGTVRYETAPGAQAQVDWASCGHFVDRQGRELPVYAFVMVLGFSRKMFVRFTDSMDLPTLLRCHMEAFEYFGGWTKKILYDNMAQVRDPNTRQLNEQFLDFANYYGFTPTTHRVRRPRTKGKVERMVYYVKDNFLNGRRFADYADLQAQGYHWLENTANSRIHETTGERPSDLFLREQLTPISSMPPYQICECSERQVSAEAFVHFEKSRYSVSPEHVGRKVVVEAHAGRIVVRAADLIIAEHRRSDKPGACVVHKEHLEQMWKLCAAKPHAALPHWEQVWTDRIAVVDLSSFERAVGGEASL